MLAAQLLTTVQVRHVCEANQQQTCVASGTCRLNCQLLAISCWREPVANHTRPREAVGRLTGSGVQAGTGEGVGIKGGIDEPDAGESVVRLWPAPASPPRLSQLAPLSPFGPRLVYRAALASACARQPSD